MLTLKTTLIKFQRCFDQIQCNFGLHWFFKKPSEWRLSNGSQFCACYASKNTTNNHYAWLHEGFVNIWAFIAFTFALDDPEDFAGFLLVGVLINLSKTNLVIFLSKLQLFLRTFENVHVVGGNDSNYFCSCFKKHYFLTVLQQKCTHHSIYIQTVYQWMYTSPCA